MIERRTAFGIAAAALCLGILGDLLFAGGTLDANVTVWVAAAAGAFAMLSRRVPQGQAAPDWLLVPLVLAAAGFSWREDPVLLFLDLVVIGLTLAAAASPAIRATGKLLGAEAVDLVVGALGCVASGVVGPFQVLAGLKPSSESSDGGRRLRVAAGAARGLLLALPLTLVFGALLVSADARFERLVARMFSIPIDEVVGHIFRTGAVGWVGAAVLAVTLVAPPRLPLPAARRQLIGTVEANTVLGVLNVLFLAFVAIQFGNLFGGRVYIMATEGLTYAEYARRGFFQLVFVCLLSLPVLLTLARQVDLEPNARRPFRALAGLQVALLLLILGSAVHRLWLYIDQFGLSLARFHAAAALLWIGATLVWFSATVLRDRVGYFLRGSLTAGGIILGAMHAINPSAVVVRTTISKAKAGAELDKEYLASLGADAVPALMEARLQLSANDREVLEYAMKCHRTASSSDGLYWSYSHWEAVRSWEGSGITGSCDVPKQ
ncbi:MAG TPA: DUF4173 domain-containing protein [Gemmatimonadales bacterium]|nr:DUF4173 domain-containing protein [Gemmatimonadales bacterium]